MHDPWPDPLAAADWPVTTERLLLRRSRMRDLAAMWAYWQDPEVNHWLTTAPPTFEAFAARQPVETVVAVELDGDVIGDLMVRIMDAWAQDEIRQQARRTQAELGWVFRPDVRGQGYATEAVRATIDLCFGPLGLHRVIAQCFAANEASWRLMERLGMRRETYARKDSLHRSGVWMDGVSYAVLAEEWPTS